MGMSSVPAVHTASGLFVLISPCYALSWTVKELFVICLCHFVSCSCKAASVHLTNAYIPADTKSSLMQAGVCM